MTGYGQFCSIARAHEVLGGRWTLLVVRELLCGSTRFNDIRRGIREISRTMLSERLQALTFIGASLGSTANTVPNTHSPRRARSWRSSWERSVRGDKDGCRDRRRMRITIWNLCSLICRGAFASRRCQKILSLSGSRLIVSGRFMLLKAAEASLCMHNPGFPEPLCVRSRLSALVSWWRGDASFVEAQRMGLEITGPKNLVRAFRSGLIDTSSPKSAVSRRRR